MVLPLVFVHGSSLLSDCGGLLNPSSISVTLSAHNPSLILSLSLLWGWAPSIVCLATHLTKHSWFRIIRETRFRFVLFCFSEFFEYILNLFVLESIQGILKRPTYRFEELLFGRGGFLKIWYQYWLPSDKVLQRFLFISPAHLQT